MRTQITTEMFFYAYLIGFVCTLNVLLYLVASTYAGGDWSLPLAVTLFSIFPVCYSLVKFFSRNNDSGEKK